jgi:hypothetical protein
MENRMMMGEVVLTYCPSAPGDFVLYFSISPDSIFFAAYFATAEAMVAVVLSVVERDSRWEACNNGRRHGSRAELISRMSRTEIWQVERCAAVSIAAVGVVGRRLFCAKVLKRARRRYV